jgi:hypothetical protein
VGARGGGVSLGLSILPAQFFDRTEKNVASLYFSFLYTNMREFHSANMFCSLLKSIGIFSCLLRLIYIRYKKSVTVASTTSTTTQSENMTPYMR